MKQLTEKDALELDWELICPEGHVEIDFITQMRLSPREFMKYVSNELIKSGLPIRIPTLDITDEMFRRLALTAAKEAGASKISITHKMESEKIIIQWL